MGLVRSPSAIKIAAIGHGRSQSALYRFEQATFAAAHTSRIRSYARPTGAASALLLGMARGLVPFLDSICGVARFGEPRGLTSVSTFEWLVNLSPYRIE